MSSWSKFECEAIVRDYFQMLMEEIAARPYSKTGHRRALQSKQVKRSDGSIEYKHQNISAILLELGYPYIQGYKPAFNYQKILKDTVLMHLQSQAGVVESKVVELADQVPEQSGEVDWNRVLETPPDRLPDSPVVGAREFNPGHYNFAAREERNRRLGQLGEEFVLEFEKYRLEQAGRLDLAREVEWTSQKLGDGAGYDIRSFDAQYEEELFIEVKTTNSGKYQPFMISDNEVAFSASTEDKYALYRVFDFRCNARIFTLQGNINENVKLQPKLYRASF
ncbi:DUF3883 domain-containing protein [Thiohalophilus thiocyanatoxydans]|uniref:Uncharacterized protein DUF3883 n=1 Tax=Thiohalophilus thiocyanatoxydans TaxID=381308 RepID=A0A4R8J107_9GAMM|nr:DUF3883 domain-containing protein [Thiohalophilus thiocyanatoxydans]TDY03997.1 uncharacterized protein DUF3883 [Thiohalophilus thiocyanatoxydans]